MKDFYYKFSQLLRDIIANYSVPVSPPFWEIPKEKRFGDFSTMLALKISPLIKKEPLAVAAEIKNIIKRELAEEIQAVEVIPPGFVNIFISRRGLIESLKSIVEEKSDFFKECRKRMVLLEFVSANPTGPLSIAHGRQAVVGDVIARIFEFFGNEVTREYYINDEGRQIELLVASVKERVKEINNEEFHLPADGYHGDYVKDMAKKTLDYTGGDLRSFILSEMLSLIKKDLSDLGIIFSSWFSQKGLIDKGEIEKTLDLLKAKKFVYEKEDALWFSSSSFGDDKDRVLRKSDGEFTYFASDIAYHKDKFKRGFDRFINLWGPDHHGYIGRVRAAVKALGFDDETLSVIIIQLVTLASKERMSRRRGTIILLSELVSEVGADAARFYYLLRKNSSPLEFDIDLAKNVSFDNPLYYIQYAHARICSVFRKAGIEDISCDYSAELQEEDLSIVRELLQFVHCLDKVYYTLEPVFLVEYLKTIAAEFHKFYEQKRVLSDDRNKTLARLAVLEAVRVVIDCGLRILGITPLTQM
ncbi:MAG: arginine--tRNA ligase [Candidatus Omnitrophota bacterium]